VDEVVGGVSVVVVVSGVGSVVVVVFIETK